MLNIPSEPEQPGEIHLPTLPALANWRDGEGCQQVEETPLFNLTPRGATLRLSCLPEIGQLLHLTLPAVPQPHGHGEGESRPVLPALVWAVAETPAPVAFEGAEAQRYAVSVLFIGQDSEASVAALASEYAVVADDDGLFRILSPDEAADIAPPVVNKRTESRIYVPIEITVEALDANGAVTAREHTVTENISRRGAAVLTSLTLPPNSLVRLTSEERRLLLTAIVRATRVDSNGVARLHLELTEREWPLDGLSS